MRKLQMLFLSFSLILNMGVVNAGSDVPFTPTEEVVETLPVESESTEVIVETATSAPTTIEQDVEESLSLESPTVEIDEEESTTIETQPVETIPTESIPTEIIEDDSVVVETPTIEEPVPFVEEKEDLETEPIEEVGEEIITNEEDIEVESSEKTVNFTKASKLLPPIKGPPLKTYGMMSLNNSGNSGVVLDKSAELMNDIDVKFKLEAFVTGTISTITQVVPTDIVLVLDQSGSMAWSFGVTPVGNRINSNQDAWDAYQDTGLLLSTGNNYYPLTVTQNGNNYTYTYVNTSGGTVRLRNLYDGSVYRASAVPKSRTQALQEVVSDFVLSVQTNADENEVDHRISMVGFGSEGSNWSDYLNTEILTTTSGNPINYRAASDTVYQESLMNVRTQNTRLQAAINAIEASGATRSDLGMDMASRVFENNPIEAGEQRQRVVIMLTDGTPTSTNVFSTDVANGAIGHSNTIKNFYGATVFTIGIFDGANPSGTSNENRYMNYVSTNYPNATLMNNIGTRGPGNYYLTADNPDDLAAIFKSISETIEAPDIEAGEATVVIDQLSPQLQLPEGFEASDVTISVYDYIHVGTESDYSSTSWQEDTDPPTGITASVQGNGRIDVTGFDYQENYVANDSTTGAPRGKKLVIEFTAQVKEDFIGGNQVLTNASNSGFYLPGKDQPAESFELPTIDVPLRFDILKEDAGQYYGTSTPANQLIKNDSKSFQIGDETYEFNGVNNKYVDITYEVFDSENKLIYTYSIPAGAIDIDKEKLDILLQLAETGTLTYKATVKPSVAGSISSLEKSTHPTLYVWYPEFELTNKTIYLGETTNPDDRYAFVKWFALKTGAIPPNYSIDGDDFDYRLSWVSGTAPIDEQDYKPSVDSTFRIDPMIKKDPECVGEDCWVSVVHSTHTNFVSNNSEKQTFTIFVKTLKLTITKKVAEDDLDPNQSFVFYITADNGYEKTVVIQGNGSATLVGLPIGTYTVEEDTDWSYRYTADLASQKTTLSRDKKEDVITVVNTIKTDVPWLSGEHFVINSYDREEEVKD